MRVHVDLSAKRGSGIEIQFAGKIMRLTTARETEQADSVQTPEDDQFELMVALLDWSQILENPAACRRLLDYLTTHVEHQKTGRSVPRRPEAEP